MKSKQAALPSSSRKARVSRKAKQANAVSTLRSLALFLQLNTRLYPKDGSSPGLVLSMLTTGEFYASLVRYEERMGQAKQVLFKAEASTIEGAITALIDSWQETVNGPLCKLTHKKH